MDVILLADVKKLGSKGDVIKVSDGYAHNYLLPRGLAEKATKSNLTQLKQQAKVQQRKDREQKAAAELLAKKLAAEHFVIKVKAGENGRLFGSVTAKDIADLVKKAGYKIDKRKIELEDQIKTLGVYDIKIKIYQQISATLKIQVVEA